jgi:hypothetical protein
MSERYEVAIRAAWDPIASGAVAVSRPAGEPISFITGVGSE